MNQDIIDILQGKLEYEGHPITIIVDDNSDVWFYGDHVTKILEYVDNSSVLQKLDPEYKKTFLELKKYLTVIPKNSQPHAIYINKRGLYMLVLGSNMPKALEFKKWIVSKVLPFVWNNRYYFIKEKYDERGNIIEDKANKIKRLRHKIKALENNQKKHSRAKKGTVYILRPMDEPNKKFKKLGFTYNFSGRLDTYQTSVPNNMELLFAIEVDDPKAVEMCMKSVIKPFIYRDNKEYYEMPLQKMIQVIHDCDKFIKGEIYCSICDAKMNHSDNSSESVTPEKEQSRVTKKNIANHLKDHHDYDDFTNIFMLVSNNVNQTGGSLNENLLQEKINTLKNDVEMYEKELSAMDRKVLECRQTSKTCQSYRYNKLNSVDKYIINVYFDQVIYTYY